jgi:hypothetical protein
MRTTPLQEELLALIGRLELVAVELIAAQASLDVREASKAPEAKARMRSLMDALEWLGSQRRKVITRQEEVG